MTHTTSRTERLLTRDDLHRFESRMFAWIRAVAIATGILAISIAGLFVQSLVG